MISRNICLNTKRFHEITCHLAAIPQNHKRFHEKSDHATQ